MTYLHPFKLLKRWLPSTFSFNILAYLHQCFLDTDTVFERICRHLQLEIQPVRNRLLRNPECFPALTLFLLTRSLPQATPKTVISLSLSCAITNTTRTHRLCYIGNWKHFSLPHSVLSCTVNSVLLQCPIQFSLFCIYDSIKWRVMVVVSFSFS